MVSAAAVGLAAALLSGGARAQSSLVFTPTFTALGEAGDPFSGRPGIRVGYEPRPAWSVEAFGSTSAQGPWDAGLSATGRWWVAGPAPGQGLHLQARVPVGLSTDRSSPVAEDVRRGPLAGLQAGLGWRPRPFLDLGLTGGGEWSGPVGLRWRAELAFSVLSAVPTAAPPAPAQRPRKPLPPEGGPPGAPPG